MADGWYYVTARGNENRRIFLLEEDYEHFLGLLAEMPDRFGIKIHGYVMLPNHYHLLLETPQPNLSQAVQWLNVAYSVWYNKRHQRSGHLLQGRFKAVIFEGAQRALPLSRHLHLNPIRGQVETEHELALPGFAAALAADVVAQQKDRLFHYRWSSYLAYSGRTEVPGWLTTADLLAELAKVSKVQSYSDYVESQLAGGFWENPWVDLCAGLILGSESFIEKVRAVVKGDSREQTALRKLAKRLDFEKVVQKVEVIKGEPWLLFRDRHGDWGRDLVFFICRQYGGFRYGELGMRAGGMDYIAVANAVRRFKERLNKDADLAALAQRIATESLA